MSCLHTKPTVEKAGNASKHRLNDASHTQDGGLPGALPPKYEENAAEEAKNMPEGRFARKLMQRFPVKTQPRLSRPLSAKVISLEDRMSPAPDIRPVLMPKPEPSTDVRKAHAGKKQTAKIIQFPGPRVTTPDQDAAIQEEIRLVAESREGNTEAFAQLVKQYERKIFRLTLRITGNQEDAADASQEAFMKAYANLKMFHGDSRFYTWLARIAVNEALTKLRKRLSHKQVSLDDDNNTTAHEITDYCDNPEQKYAKTELQGIMAEAINGLTPALKMVLLLQYLEDCTSEQIARKLGLSVPAVKSRLMRARLKLRQRLSKHFRQFEINGSHPRADEAFEEQLEEAA